MRPATPPSPQDVKNNALASRLLLRKASQASLGTVDRDSGAPYVSLVTMATLMDGAPVFLFSSLSDHTKNIAQDVRASLLVSDTDGLENPQTGARVTLMGTLVRLEGESAQEARSRFLARHPGAALYVDFADFGFFQFQIERGHFVGGFGRAVWIEKGLTLDPDVAAGFARGAPTLLDQLSKEHPDGARLLANRGLKKRGKHWAFAAIDADGIDLRLKNRTFRLAFAAPQHEISQAKSEVSALIMKAKDP